MGDSHCLDSLVSETRRDAGDGGDVRRSAHNPEVEGSNPSPATKMQVRGPFRTRMGPLACGLRTDLCMALAVLAGPAEAPNCPVTVTLSAQTDTVRAVGGFDSSASFGQTFDYDDAASGRSQDPPV